MALTTTFSGAGPSPNTLPSCSRRAGLQRAAMPRENRRHSVFQIGGPVQYDIELFVVGLRNFVDQEFPAVIGYRVLQPCTAGDDGEQRVRKNRIQTVPGLDFRGHQFSPRRDKVQLSGVPAPDGPPSALA